MKRKYLMITGIFRMGINILLLCVFMSCQSNTKKEGIILNKKEIIDSLAQTQLTLDTISYQLLSPYRKVSFRNENYIVIKKDSLDNIIQITKVKDRDNEFDFNLFLFDSLKMELTLETKNEEQFLMKFYNDTSSFKYSNYSYYSGLIPSYSILEEVLFLEKTKDSVYVFKNVIEVLSLEKSKVDYKFWSTSYVLYPYVPLIIKFSDAGNYLKIDTLKNDLFKNQLIELENHPNYQNLLDEIATDREETQKILDEMEIERDLNNKRE